MSIGSQSSGPIYRTYRTAALKPYHRKRQTHSPHELDATPQAGLRHRHRDLPGMRWQAQSDRLHRGPTTDREDPGPCSSARSPFHQHATITASVTTRTDTHLKPLGSSPRVRSAARRVFRLFAWIQRPDRLVECFQTPARLPTTWIFQPYSAKHTCLIEQSRGLFFLFAVPFVLQTSLDDNYVAYELNAFTKKAGCGRGYSPNCTPTFWIHFTRPAWKSPHPTTARSGTATKPPWPRSSCRNRARKRSRKNSAYHS